MDTSLLPVKAIADETRVRILKLLEEGELCVCEITEVLDLAASTISKHLSILRTAQLIKSRKQGKWVFYALNANSGAHQDYILKYLRNNFNSEEKIQNDRLKLLNTNFNEICIKQ